MPSAEEISLSQQSLYDSAALRDDLNDTEATILLTWGEGQVARIAEAYPNEFEQKNRFLRQLIKGINRFVGQREFNEIEGQKEYLSKVTLYFQHLGWEHVTEEALFAAMPADKKDMLGTLRAILALLSPPTSATPPSMNPPSMNPPASAAMPPSMAVTDNLATPSTMTPAATEALPPALTPPAAEISHPFNQSLENPNQTGINQTDNELNEE